MSKYTVYLMSGASFEVSLNDYNADAIAKHLNDQKTIYISIGDVVMSKQMLSHIIPPVVSTESAE